MKKYNSFFITILVVMLTLMTGCNSSEESVAGDIATENALASQAAPAATSRISEIVESEADNNESIDSAALSKSKGTEQDVIIALVPVPGQENVSKETKIEVTFSVPLDISAIKEHDVKLTNLSSKTNDHIVGTISYSETDMKLTFTPKDQLEPGMYEIEIKSLKADKAYKAVKIKEIKYRFIVVKEVLQRIVVTPEQADIKEGEQLQFAAFGHYDSGIERNITTKVAWSVADSQKAAVDVNATLRALNEGTTAVFAKMAGVEANASIVIYKEIDGHRLPPEPDPQVNNATLLGIDINNNGVRDDVERWIYSTYDKSIERAVLMQRAKAYQIIIVEPEKAFVNLPVMQAATRCESYWSMRAKRKGELVWLDEYREYSKEIRPIQFNTAARFLAYDKYNQMLSGGVFSGDKFEDWKGKCDFNASILVKVP